MGAHRSGRLRPLDLSGGSLTLKPDIIGSEQWRQQAETRWHHLHVREFDEVRTFRHDCLQEIVSLRPRAWRGVLPWRLHDHEDHSALDGTFVAYLDVNLALYDWRQRMFILNGRGGAVEVKRPGKQPTIFQQAELDAIARAGGWAIVAHDVDDVIKEVSE